MTRIILSGCNGKMGQTITACVAGRDDCTIVAGFDINTTANTYPVFADPATCTVEADVIIDFSHPAMLDGVLRYARSHKLPVVLATTGLSEQQLSDIQAATADTAVFSSANMSLGISLLAELAKKAAAVLGTSFDVEIIEKHHNQKIDAPSGTAIMLANAVKEGLPYEPEYVYDRHAVRQKRAANEIGFSSIRGGTIVGEHDVLFAGHDECITLSHTATSKGVFATGAINAALFLVGKPAGYYTMKDLVAEN